MDIHNLNDFRESQLTCFVEADLVGFFIYQANL